MKTLLEFRILRPLWILVGLLCAAPAFGQLSLHPGQMLQLRSSSQGRLNVLRRVSSTGLVRIPLIGLRSAIGMTPLKLAESLNAELLAQGLVPDLSVELAADRSSPIYFGGAVEVQGSIIWTEGLTAGAVIAFARPTNAGNTHLVVLATPGRPTRCIDATGTDKNLVLLPGDALWIPTGGAPEDVNVLGSVLRPGTVLFKDGLTVAQAIELAGGFNGHSDLTDLSVERKRVRLTVTLQSILQRGDTLRIGTTIERKFVAVKGAVVRPGVVPFRKGMKLSEILAGAGGTTERADLGRVQRFAFPSGKQSSIDFAKIKAGKAKDIELTANDTIIVPYLEVVR